MKHIAELFGQSIESLDIEKIEKTSYECPFLCKKCVKQSRLIDYPMGVCSVSDKNKNVKINLP